MDPADRDKLLLESIVENIPDMIFVKEAEGLRFVLFNRAGEELLGHGRAEMIGKNDYDFFPKEEADFFTSKDSAVLGSSEVLDIPEEPIETKLKGRRWLHTKKIALRGADGRPAYLLGISEDVTDRKRALDQLARRTEELTRANRALEDFAYAAAHDLRAPLRRLATLCERMQERLGEGLDQEGRSLLGRGKDAVTEMGALLNALLELGGLARTEPRREQVDLSAMARELLAELRHEEPEREAAVSVAEGLRAEGDPAMMRIVLRNLLDNAWKFSSQRASASIAVGAAEPREGLAVFYVRDDGAGFDMAHKERLFKAFARLHTREQFPGSGLGLATVERILSAHRGAVWLDSAPGKGTTVYFGLPKA